MQAIEPRAPHANDAQRVEVTADKAITEAAHGRNEVEHIDVSITSAEGSKTDTTRSAYIYDRIIGGISKEDLRVLTPREREAAMLPCVNALRSELGAGPIKQPTLAQRIHNFDVCLSLPGFL